MGDKRLLYASAQFGTLEYPLPNGDTFVNGFIPCHVCATKINKGKPLNQVVVRPWPLECGTFWFIKEYEGVLKDYFRRMDQLDMSDNTQDGQVCEFLSIEMGNRWDLAFYKMKLDPGNTATYKKEARKGCADFYRRRLQRGQFDDYATLLRHEQQRYEREWDDDEPDLDLHPDL